MRIAHIQPWVSLGGAEIAALRLASAARRAGHEDFFFFPALSGSAVDLVRASGFETATYAAAEPRKRHPLSFVLSSIRLARALRRRRIDVVHCVDALGARSGALAGRLAGGFVICHVVQVQDWLSRLDRALLRPVHRYVFTSQSVWDSFAVRVSAANGEVLYEGYSAEPASIALTREVARERFGLHADAVVFGMAARVAPQKDFETLIRAGAIVRARLPRCRFLIAGDHRAEPQNRTHYESLLPLLRETGMEAAFVFAGMQSEIHGFFAAIDAFVLSTHTEGMGLVLLEAMAHRKPIVATAVGGVLEAVEDDRNGILVPPRSPDRLAAAMLRLVEEPHTAARLVDTASEVHRARFSAAVYEERVARLYARIATLRASSGPTERA